MAVLKGAHRAPSATSSPPPAHPSGKPRADRLLVRPPSAGRTAAQGVPRPVRRLHRRAAAGGGRAPGRQLVGRVQTQRGAATRWERSHSCCADFGTSENAELRRPRRSSRAPSPPMNEPPRLWRPRWRQTVRPTAD